MNAFAKWLDRFVEEKGIDPEEILEVPGASGVNFIPVAAVVEVMKSAPVTEQAALQQMIVRLDFLNRAIVPYFRHLAQALAV